MLEERAYALETLCYVEEQVLQLGSLGCNEMKVDPRRGNEVEGKRDPCDLGLV
jgi:hypothetical protein